MKKKSTKSYLKVRNGQGKVKFTYGFEDMPDFSAKSIKTAMRMRGELGKKGRGKLVRYLAMPQRN